MNDKTAKHSKLIQFIIIVVIIITIAVTVYTAINGRQYFNRRTLRQVQLSITSYGYLSPLAIISLIFLSNVIPPLPLPVPLLEMAGGLIFGFWPGFILAWISQFISSIFIFGVSRSIGKKYFAYFLNNRIMNTYRNYIHKKGAVAVFVTRAMMANPFNIVSFLPGLNQMDTLNFSLATALGTIPEAALFAFLGSLVKYTRIKLWSILILTMLLSAVGPIITLVIIGFRRTGRKK